MERTNTKQTLLDMGRFAIFLFCKNLGLKYENKCVTKAQKRKWRTHPTVQGKTLKPQSFVDGSGVKRT